MSSPAASGVGDASAKKPLEQITFRFCSECSNMLYPKEDENERKLLFTCRTCNYSTDATSSCIYRNILNNKAGETAGVTQDVGSDPTVGHPHDFVAVGARSFSPDLHPDDLYSPVLGFIDWMDEPYDWEEDPSSDEAEEEDGSEKEKEAADGYEDEGEDARPHKKIKLSGSTETPYSLPRSNKTCPACKHEEAVFFQSQQRSAETGMRLFYVCCDCGNIFQ